MSLTKVSVSSPIFDDISSYISSSYPNSCIIFIDEIMNVDLLDAYETRKEIIKNNRGYVKELRLFHGTKKDIFPKIIKNGFKKEFNKVSAFGKGTYFSTTASYSLSYTDVDKEELSYLFVCNVLVGNSTCAKNNMEIDIINYDNGVNDLNNPSIYVIPHDDAIYPLYVVGFYRSI